MAVIFNINAQQQLDSLGERINELAQQIGSQENLQALRDDIAKRLTTDSPRATGSFSLNLSEEAEPGEFSTTEGSESVAGAQCSHAEGYKTTVTKTGVASHAEGYITKTLGQGSHAEGGNTKAEGKYSHAEGTNTAAIGEGSHVEGGNNTVYASFSHVEGYDNKITEAYSSVQYAHIEGIGNEARGSYQHVAGRYATPDSSSLRITGAGNSAISTKNVETLDQSGNLRLAGMLYIDKNGTGDINQAVSVGKLIDDETAARKQDDTANKAELSASIKTEQNARVAQDNALSERIDSLKNDVTVKDDQNLKLTGEQTARGVKVFSDGIVIPTSKPATVHDGSIWIS